MKKETEQWWQCSGRLIKEIPEESHNSRSQDRYHSTITARLCCMWEEKKICTQHTEKRNRVHTVCLWGVVLLILISCILSWVNHNMGVGGSSRSWTQTTHSMCSRGRHSSASYKAVLFFSKRAGKYLEICRDTTEAMKSLHYVATWPFSLKRQAMPNLYAPI